MQKRGVSLLALLGAVLPKRSPLNAVSGHSHGCCLGLPVLRLGEWLNRLREVGSCLLWQHCRNTDSFPWRVSAFKVAFEKDF